MSSEWRQLALVLLVPLLLVGVPLGVVMVSVCRADEDRRRGIWGLWIGVGMLVVLALAYLVLALW